MNLFNELNIDDIKIQETQKFTIESLVNEGKEKYYFRKTQDKWEMYKIELIESDTVGISAN